jgi:hypothetical protein
MLRQNKFEPCFQDTDLMPFGKFKGEPLQDIPASYLKWLYDEMKPECGTNALGNINPNKQKIFNYIHNSMDAIRLELKDR